MGKLRLRSHDLTKSKLNYDALRDEIVITREDGVTARYNFLVTGIGQNEHAQNGSLSLLKDFTDFRYKSPLDGRMVTLSTKDGTLEIVGASACAVAAHRLNPQDQAQFHSDMQARFKLLSQKSSFSDLTRARLIVPLAPVNNDAYTFIAKEKKKVVKNKEKIYCAGLDAAAAQKFEAIRNLLPPIIPGPMVDFGSGTGAITHALAQHMPTTTVIGVDSIPERVTLSQSKYKMPNVKFVTGRENYFQYKNAELGGVILSSVLHEVFSFVHPRYSCDNPVSFLQDVGRATRSGGSLVLRDFVNASHVSQQQVSLHLRADDGQYSDQRSSLTYMSSARLFELFLKQAQWIPANLVEQITKTINHDGFVEFHSVDISLATEFLLRRKYTSHWNEELKEQYLFWTPSQATSILENNGFRILKMEVVRNRWMEENWFRSFSKLTLGDKEVDYPATHIQLVAEKL